MLVTPYISILFFTAAMSAGAAITAWRRRAWAGGLYLAAMMAAISLWNLTLGAALAAVDIPVKFLWNSIEYFGYCPTAALYLLFVLQFTRRDKHLTPLLKSSLFIIPAITVILVWTNSSHGLIWRNTEYVSSSNLLVHDWGIWFWIFAGYTYLLTFTGIAILAGEYAKADKNQRNLHAILIVGSLFPLLTGIIYMIRLPWLKGLDISTLGFSVTGIIFSWSLYRRRLLGLIPVGRRMLVEHMTDGVLVLDNQDRIADINPAARKYLTYPADSYTGRSINSAFPADSGISSLLENMVEGTGEVELTGGKTLFLKVNVSVIRFSRQSRGRLVILRDITNQKQAERERERLLAELKQALAQIQTLQGLLPICSVCKKIRDEKGNWRNFETYIRNHTGAEFSHGYCPECESRYDDGLIDGK